MNDYAKKMIQKDPMMYVNANGVRPLPREMMGNEFEQSGRYGRVITRTPATSFDMGMPGVGGTYDSELFRKMMEEKMRGQQSEMDEMMRSRGQEAIQQQRDAFAEEAARQAEEAMREGEGGPGKDGVEMHSGGGMMRGSGMGMGMPRMERQQGGPGSDRDMNVESGGEPKEGMTSKDYAKLLSAAGEGLEGIAKGISAARGDGMPSDRGSSNLPDMDMGDGESSLGQKFVQAYLAEIMKA